MSTCLFCWAQLKTQGISERNHSRETRKTIQGSGSPAKDLRLQEARRELEDSSLAVHGKMPLVVMAMGPPVLAANKT